MTSLIIHRSSYTAWLHRVCQAHAVTFTLQTTTPVWFLPYHSTKVTHPKSLVSSTLPNQTGFSNLYLSCHSKQRGRVGPASFTDPILMTSRTMGISGLSLTLTSLCHLLPNHFMFLVILRDSVLHFSGHTHSLSHIMQSLWLQISFAC